MDDVIIKKGEKEGNISVIIAGTHGNERSGVIAFQKLLPQLEIDTGTVYFIYGNPRAIKAHKRFTEYNLNRLFLEDDSYPEEVQKTYEFTRAQFIKTYLDKASALLDLHSTTADTEPFIFAEKYAFPTLDFFPREFSKIVSGVEDIEPGGTDGYMSRRGKIGICVEGGRHDDEKVINLALHSIHAFLIARGHLINANIIGEKLTQRDFIHLSYAYYTKENFRLVKEFKDFSFVQKNELIGYDGREEVRVPSDGVILFAQNQDDKNVEAFLFAEKK